MKKRMPSEMEQTRERKRAPRRVFARRRDASEKGGSEAARRVPLHALLSRAYGAFVIEFDNEFERQMPHRTARYGVARGEGEDLRGEDLPDEEVPYLVSMVIWERFLRHIDDDEGVAAGELLRRVRTNRKQLKNWLTRTGKWWGYVEIKRGRDPGADDAGGGAGGSTRVRLTRAGRMARRVWMPLAGRIETCWEERFGLQQIDALRRSLAGIGRVRQADEQD